MLSGSLEMLSLYLRIEIRSGKCILGQQAPRPKRGVTDISRAVTRTREPFGGVAVAKLSYEQAEEQEGEVGAVGAAWAALLKNEEFPGGPLVKTLHFPCSGRGVFDPWSRN